MRILFVTGGSPWPTSLGANQRTNLLLRALREVAEVDLVIYSAYAATSPEDEAVLRRDFGLIEIWRPRTATGPLAGALRTLSAGFDGGLPEDHAAAARLTALLGSGRYDAVVCRYARPLAACGALNHQVPVLLDADDIDIQVMAHQVSRLSGLARLKGQWRLNGLKRRMAPLLASPRHVWIVSESDRAYAPHDRVSVLPNIPFPGGGETPDLPPAEGSQRVLLVASFKHGPNIEGTDRFVRSTWPGIRKRRPDATLRIVGHGMTEAQKAAWNAVEGVDAVGEVDRLEPEYAAAALSVAPIWEGGGTKIKVLESLLHGRALAGSDHALRGLEPLTGGTDGLASAPTEAALGDLVTAMLGDPAACARQGAEGRRRVLREYGWDRFRSVVADGVARATGA